jgi:acyl carrier protein
VAHGYWRRKQESRTTFNGRLENDDTAYLRTGDLGFIHRGELYVTGRRKDLIIISGRNHYPHDIEATVQDAHAALERGAGAAFSITGPGGQERLAVVQELSRKHEAGVDGNSILDAIRVAVSERHGLAVSEIALTTHGAVPRTMSGKVQRNACREMHLAGQFRTIACWRQTDDVVERAIFEESKPPLPAPDVPPIAGLSREDASVALIGWMKQRVSYELRVPESELDPNMHFGLYGLDSLIAVTMTALLSRAVNIELEETLLWDYPNFNLLSSYLLDRIFSPREPV